MTFVGKILVILIMAFSLVFLGVSTVVFTTATNWKTVTEKQKGDMQKLQTQLASAKEQAKIAQTQLETATKDHQKAVAEKETRIADLDRQVKSATEEAQRAQTSLGVAQANAKTALEDAAARKAQIDILNATIAKAQEQANQFSKQNLELTDQVRILEREKATAEQNAKDLRAFKAKSLAMLAKMGVAREKVESSEESHVPEKVDGKVVKLNSSGRSMELSIGSDDGLAISQELNIFRTTPRPEYIGKVRVVAVYPDTAVAEVIGNTVNGKKILEGDIVSSTFDAH